MKAIIISANSFEDLELHYPLYRLREDGIDVTVAANEKGMITGKHGYTVGVHKAFPEVNPDDYDLLIIPGGQAPEEVRLHKDALRIVRGFFEAGKPVGSICHGAQVLVSAGVLKGRNVTCWKGVKDDVIAAGANYTDVEVVVDGNLVTSRMPNDLPAFMRETGKLINAKAGLKAA
jgi:protease I